LDEAFAYAADFANLEDWDPGVAESSQIGTEPVGVGTEFDVLVAFGSRRIPMVYTITEYDPPHRVAFIGEGSTLTAVDTIEFSANGAGTEITYTADLTFKGIAKFFTPFMGRRLDDVGRKAVEGLNAALRERRVSNDS
jgi:carbon monoxide dehydrogenase subunit G